MRGGIEGTYTGHERTCLCFYVIVLIASCPSLLTHTQRALERYRTREKQLQIITNKQQGTSNDHIWSTRVNSVPSFSPHRPTSLCKESWRAGATSQQSVRVCQRQVCRLGAPEENKQVREGGRETVGHWRGVGGKEKGG